MAISYICAVGVGLGGSSFIDVVAPIYTIFIGSLVLTKFYGKDQLTIFDQMPNIDVDVVESKGSSIAAKPLSDLIEPSSGIAVPGLLDLSVPGSPNEMVSLSCGIRLKKVAGFNVKIYVLGVFVGKSETTSKSLESFKTSSSGVFDCLLSTDQTSFFPRALHMTFCRSVTGKQVADALGERLKANVSPVAFDSFSSTLLAGIGSKGMSTGETLSFLWYEPNNLRIFVRGTVSGEVEDVKLPRAIHAGFLGEDPSIPEARQAIPMGLSRLFQAVASTGVKRAGRALAPSTITEPTSGIQIPSTIELGDTSMHLLSVGLQVKKLGFVSVQVYVAGILVEPQDAKRHLSGWFKAASESGSSASGSPNALYDALLSKESFFPRALHLVFCRNVTGKQVADSLAERLKANVSPIAFDSFSSTLLAGIGNGVNKGESLSYLWYAPNSLRIFVRGSAVGDVQDDKLPRAIHVGFLGSNDPNAPQAREGVPAAMIKLLSAS